MIKLLARSSIGGYSVIYHTNNGDILCAECATKENIDKNNGFIHWEGETMHCDGCNTELESEYGNPEEEN